MNGIFLDNEFIEQVEYEYSNKIFEASSVSKFILNFINSKNVSTNNEILFLEFDNDEMSGFYRDYFFNSTAGKYFTEYFLDLVLKWAQIHLEKIIWTDGQNFNPLIKLIDENNNIKSVSKELSNSKLNTLEKIKIMIESSNNKLKYDNNKIIYCYDDFFNEFITDLKNMNCYNDKNIERHEWYNKYFLYDDITKSNIQIVTTPGLNNINMKYSGEPIIFTTSKNIELKIKKEMYNLSNFSVWWSSDSNSHKARIIANICQLEIINPELIVRGYSL